MELLGYFTSWGKTLSAKLLSGAALDITRIAAGCETTPLDAKAMLQEQQVLPVFTPVRNGNAVTFPVTLDASQAGSSYSLKEIGIYANDPDAGEILYCLYRLTPEFAITAGSPLIIRFDLLSTVSEAAEISILSPGTGVLTTNDLGVPGGVASLNAQGKIPAEQVPYTHTYGTSDLQAGVTALETGKLHFVYE